MAMSRSLGWTWFTTRPPISISPPEMFSRPAIMRSSVDLPHPEGPTRTQNWPSSIDTSTPRTTSLEPKDLRTCLRATLAILRGRLPSFDDDVCGLAGAGPVDQVLRRLSAQLHRTFHR